MTLEEAQALEWGTYGKGVMEKHAAEGTPLPPVTFKTLGELESDHLRAIFYSQRQITEEYREAIRLILAERKRFNEEEDQRVEDALLNRRREAVEATRRKRT